MWHLKTHMIDVLIFFSQTQITIDSKHCTNVICILGMAVWVCMSTQHSFNRLMKFVEVTEGHLLMVWWECAHFAHNYQVNISTFSPSNPRTLHPPPPSFYCVLVPFLKNISLLLWNSRWGQNIGKCLSVACGCAHKIFLGRRLQRKISCLSVLSKWTPSYNGKHRNIAFHDSLVWHKIDSQLQ